MKIAFTGIGSIAKKHIANLRKVLNDRAVDATIDVYRSGKGQDISDDIASLVDNVIAYDYATPVTQHYDIVFITNPTSKHYDTLKLFYGCADAFFIEKPVFDRTDVDLSFIDAGAGKLFYVACPVRYNSVIRYVHDNIDFSKVISARAISSSYLPEWRPGTDYRKCYSAIQELGGGVDIDLVHEWDYLSYLFGPVKEGFAIRGKLSNLEINSVDTAIYVARTDKTALEVHLDYFGRKSLRCLELFMQDDTVECDLLKGTVTYLKENRTLSFDNDRNIFKIRELEAFLDMVSGIGKNDSTIEHGLRALKYAKGEF